MAATESQLSVKTAVTRTVLWTVAAIVAGAAGVLEYSQTWQLHAAETAAAGAVANVLATQVGGAGDAATLQEICKRAVGASCVLGVWMVDEKGAASASAVRYTDVNIFGSETAGPPGGRPIELPVSATRAVRAAHMFEVPINRRNATGTLRVLVQLSRSEIPWTGRIWTWIGPLVLLGAISSLVGLRRLHADVVSPITQLGRVSDDGTDHVASASVRNDEIGHLARALLSLRTDRDEWRARAEQTARTVDAHVTQRTQAIRTELRRAQREIWTDPLTRLNNRRVLQDRFGAIFDSQKEAGQDLSVVMVDIDNFKPLNDTLGHLCGDELLKFCADLLRGSLRTNDLAIRYGGDEFTLILPSVSAADAASIAQRTVALFAQRTKLLPALENPPSLSAGVASLWAHTPSNAEELLQMADKALYDAKAAGRNSVQTFAVQRTGRIAAAPASRVAVRSS